MVFGSGNFFDDQYLEQECNDQIREIVFGFLTSSTEVQLHPVDADDPDVSFNMILTSMLYSLEEIEHLENTYSNRSGKYTL